MTGGRGVADPGRGARTQNPKTFRIGFTTRRISPNVLSVAKPGGSSFMMPYYGKVAMDEHGVHDAGDLIMREGDGVHQHA